MNRMLRSLRRLRPSQSGVAAVEFALGLPLLLSVGLWGAELGNLAITHMRVSQLAMQIADNGSRIGDVSMLENLKIYETDINDAFIGAKVQSGGLDLFNHGRVIMSSLEVVDGTADTQYIHWQRCKGKRNVQSSYGPAGTGADGSLEGMGPAGEEVTAAAGDAVIYVEVEYEYQPLVSARFVPGAIIRATAAFNVRDDRDLTQIFQRDAASPDPVASCTVYDGYD
ncbi:TadE/TadG family type IV pilus assembly protein [Novosphingobium sp. MMS21-SN21R]|uniref:TadE/TadG family type IV pilus assembly protein n=1 Tax=Novosphingobium sp. MMS21-SN21R TaxID=2969298 RepID=UPI0028878F61|nr:TadE/TadG family type IV pilus assembly protein [Novosphingobium sp. MMS21-SN21R]MDT0508107.1 TadE/TadG family type IV pilus assembly protein [Novosphingobium sp. MMS21-SN21R]